MFALTCSVFLYTLWVIEYPTADPQQFASGPRRKCEWDSQGGLRQSVAGGERAGGKTARLCPH